MELKNAVSSVICWQIIHDNQLFLISWFLTEPTLVSTKCVLLISYGKDTVYYFYFMSFNEKQLLLWQDIGMNPGSVSSIC